jgi:hypothetical protein
VVKGDLFPNEVAALGIKFSAVSHRVFAITLAAVVAYFLVAFLIYGVADYLAARLALLTASTDHWLGPDRRRPESTSLHLEAIAEIAVQRNQEARRKLHYPTLAMSRTRIGFDFALPIALSCYALVVLLKYLAITP